MKKDNKCKCTAIKNVELGQALFGNKFSSYDAPEFVIAGFLLLEDEIHRVEWNMKQETIASPLSNGVPVYKNKVFEIYSYYWGDNKKLKERANFKCGSFEVRWYKHMGRGMTMNKKIDANEFFRIIDKCLSYLRKKDKENFKRIIK